MSLPERYAFKKVIKGETQVYDQETEKWIPEWAMMPGYRWMPNG